MYSKHMGTRMKKLNVIISDDSNHAADGSQAKQWLDTLLTCQNNDGTPTALVASQAQLNVLRLAVIGQRISPFEFQFNGGIVTCDCNGNLIGNVEGLFDELSQSPI